MSTSSKNDITRPIRWPVWLAVANILAVFSVWESWNLSNAKGESAMAVVVLWPMIVLPAQVMSWIALIVARRRREKPWWAYLTALSPVVFVVAVIILNLVMVLVTGHDMSEMSQGRTNPSCDVATRAAA